MFVRSFFFLIGFGLTVIGFTFIISYLNLLSIGYNLEEYGNFIVRRVECWNVLIGVSIMLICLLKGDNNELCI